MLPHDYQMEREAQIPHVACLDAGWKGSFLFLPDVMFWLHTQPVMMLWVEEISFMPGDGESPDSPQRSTAPGWGTGERGREKVSQAKGWRDWHCPGPLASWARPQAAGAQVGDTLPTARHGEAPGVLTGGWHPTHLGSDSRMGQPISGTLEGVASRTWAARTGLGFSLWG